MALLPSSVLPSTLNIKVKQFEHQPSQLHGLLLQVNGYRRVSPKCGMKTSMVQFGEPSKFKEQLNSMKERNQELMIPFGLIVGCLMSDFLKETFQEVFRSSEGKDLKMKWQLLAISGFFVVVKFVSTYFAMRTRVYLLHVANGGLMQVLWLWRSLLKENGGNLLSMQDGSSAADAESRVL
ncbi:hypothetical protein REPUB_Repub02eG0065700 [Reevesia pubescens]